MLVRRATSTKYPSHRKFTVSILNTRFDKNLSEGFSTIAKTQFETEQYRFNDLDEYNISHIVLTYTVD
jgi:hypothetical protein